MTELALVTGATGFVGSALCRALLESGHRVRALHRPTSDLRALADLPVELFQGDILDAESMHSACRGVRWVYHAASQSAYWRQPEAVRRSAVDGTRHLSEAALSAGVDRFVFTSSVSALGIPAPGELLTEAHTFDLPEARFPYGSAKRQAELTLLDVVARGLEAVIVNPSLILGPGDRNRISGSMVIEAARGWGFFYLEGGANYIHIDDVVAGHLAAAQRGQTGKRYILGDENLTHAEAFTIINQVVGRRPPWLKIPSWVVSPAARIVGRLAGIIRLPFDADQLWMSQHRLFCEIEPARQALGLAAPIPFRQAAEQTYRWYREEGLV